MRIQTSDLYFYSIPLKNGSMRQGALILLVDEGGRRGWGEIAPLPKWSQETLQEALHSLQQKMDEILKIEWTCENCLGQLEELHVLPSASFGLESAILAIVSPLLEFKVEASALLMGSSNEILAQAQLRQEEGYRSAKLKVGNLAFEEAFDVIHQLKDRFFLRIDVNRAWKTSDSLRFFSQFPKDTFDYVEEPFQDPCDLKLFSHPLAVDESFSQTFSLEHLRELPTLKALIYKPTIQGGMMGCMSLYRWTQEKKVDLVLSSCFESDLGLARVASIAHRLSLFTPVGIGTRHFFDHVLCKPSLSNGAPFVLIPASLQPQMPLLNRLYTEVSSV